MIMPDTEALKQLIHKMYVYKLDSKVGKELKKFLQRKHTTGK